MKIPARFLGLALISVIFARALFAETPPTVFAAASVGKALGAVLSDYPGTARISVAGSGTLARQIAQGAPADVVLLANPKWMEWLVNQGYILSDTVQSPFGNALAIVAPKGAPEMTNFTAEAVFARLGASGRLAIGEHRSVPVGQYAKDWLAAQSLWTALQQRVAEADNARAVLALVARKEVPLAILYRSDLTAAPDKIAEVWTIPAAEQPLIRYAVAAVTDAGRPVVDYLMRPDVRARFAEFGFIGVAE